MYGSLLKPLLSLLAIILILLYLIGVIRFERPTYSCFEGRSLRFGERVELINVGALRVYGFPLVSDCPEDRRFDANTIYECGDNIYCQKPNKEEIAD